MFRSAIFSLTVLAVLALASGANAQGLEALEGLDGSLADRGIQLFLLITVLSLAPGLAIMITCFPFIVTVLAILRQAIGLQQSPPNMLIVSLALFLTWFVMDPVFQAAWTAGGAPYSQGLIDIQSAVARAAEPFRGFMMARTDPETLAALSDLRPEGAEPTENGPAFALLIPSFMLSELARAFEIGFLIYLPFLIIDLVVAAILMSMGMMMVPPAVVSLPFKLAFFVVADGWQLISEALVRSYG
ncbi:MAG: flagellar type III secretion system pore protein FliP [Pseudomonadota bacterium]